MVLGRGQLAEPERRRPHGMVRLEQEGAIIRALGEGEKLASDAAGRRDSSSPGRDHPLTPQRSKGQPRLTDALRQLSGAGEHALGFRRAEPFQHLDRRAQVQEKRQLVPIAVGALGQRRDDVQSFREVAHRVRVG